MEKKKCIKHRTTTKQGHKVMNEKIINVFFSPFDNNSINLFLVILYGAPIKYILDSKLCASLFVYVFFFEYFISQKYCCCCSFFIAEYIAKKFIYRDKIYYSFIYFNQNGKRNLCFSFFCGSSLREFSLF